MTDKEKTYKFSLSGSGGDVTVKDRPISEDKALRMLTIAMSNAETTGEDRLFGHSQPLRSDVAGTSHDSTLNPKIFMAQKKPSSEIERITCLAYYLTHHRSIPAFKTREITKINQEAAQPTFSNATIFARNAVQYGYLALAGQGNKQITALGDAVVNALPDREQVKAAIDEYKLRHKRRSKKRQK